MAYIFFLALMVLLTYDLDCSKAKEEKDSRYSFVAYIDGVMALLAYLSILVEFHLQLRSEYILLIAFLSLVRKAVIEEIE